MAVKKDERTCPFCGELMLLRDAPIVATGVGVGDTFGSWGASTPERHDGINFYDDPPDDASNATQVAEPTDSQASSVAGYELLWSAADAEEDEDTGSWVTRMLSGGSDPVRSLERFPVEKIARRLCPACLGVLPPDLDTRQAHIVAVVGLNGAGKSHYLAAALRQAVREQGLSPIGITEFAPDDDTAPRLHQEYILKLFRRGQLLSATHVDDDVARKPLTFRVTAEGHEPILLMTHDISGETLMDYRKRARIAPFLARASALIFLLDPTEFDSVRDQLPDSALVDGDRYIHQADLLRSCLAALAYDSVPIAITIAKADLMANILEGIELTMEPLRKDRWVDDVIQRSDAIRDLLLKLDERAIVQAVDEHPQVTFHAVSALGGQPSNMGVQVRPLRCLEPLATVLARLMHAVAR